MLYCIVLYNNVFRFMLVLLLLLLLLLYVVSQWHSPMPQFSECVDSFTSDGATLAYRIDWTEHQQSITYDWNIDLKFGTSHTRTILYLTHTWIMLVWRDYLTGYGQIAHYSSWTIWPVKCIRINSPWTPTTIYYLTGAVRPSRVFAHCFAPDSYLANSKLII